MGLNGLMHHLEIYILTRDNMKQRDCKCTQQMRILNRVTHRRMHFSPLLCGTCLLCDAPPVPSGGWGDPLLLSPGQLSSHPTYMRLTNAISAGLCIRLCRACKHPCAFYCNIKIFWPGHTSGTSSRYTHPKLNSTHSHCPLLPANCWTHLSAFSLPQHGLCKQLSTEQWGPTCKRKNKHALCMCV